MAHQNIVCSKSSLSIAALTVMVWTVTVVDLPAFGQNVEPNPTSAQENYSAQPEDAYSLGSGNLVRADIFDTPELKLEERYPVLVDGSINLPWVGTVFVQGLTLEQASELLASRYSRFIRKPLITLSLISPRPLKVTVFGEVQRPGSYIISPIGSETGQTSLGTRSATETGSQWPTVTKAIQTAGGIKQVVNVRKIQVHRPQRVGPEKVIDVG